MVHRVVLALDCVSDRKEKAGRGRRIPKGASHDRPSGRYARALPGFAKFTKPSHFFTVLLNLLIDLAIFL